MDNQNYFCVINTATLPVVYTLQQTVKKFSAGFKQHGFMVREINSWEQLESIPDTKRVVFFISNHGVEDNWDNTKLLPLQRYKHATKLLWHFHSFMLQHQSDSNYSLPFDNWLLTGEHMHSAPLLASHIKSYNFQYSLKNYHPLTFSTYIAPEVVGTIPRGPVVWDAQFVGSPYKTEWSSRLPNSFIRTQALSTSEEERVSSFLKAHCALGFHSRENIANNVVVERIPEALGFGAVCLTDSPAAVAYTDGCAVLVSSFPELEYYISLYKSDTAAAEIRRKAGYEWTKAKGTYYHLAGRFMDKLETLGYR